MKVGSKRFRGDQGFGVQVEFRGLRLRVSLDLLYDVSQRIGFYMARVRWDFRTPRYPVMLVRTTTSHVMVCRSDDARTG